MAKRPNPEARVDAPDRRMERSGGGAAPGDAAPDGLFTVGVIAGTHGLRGDVKVVSRTDFPERRFVKGSRLLLARPDGALQELTVEAARAHKNVYLVVFAGFDAIEQVESLRGCELKVTAAELPPLPEGEYYYHELIGCSVYDDEDRLLGVLTEVLKPGANDVYVVGTPSGRSVLLPAIRDCILRVDPPGRRVDVHIMPGLLD